MTTATRIRPQPLVFALLAVGCAETTTPPEGSQSGSLGQRSDPDGGSSSHEVQPPTADASTPAETDTGAPPSCGAHEPRVAVCIQSLDGGGDFTNDSPPLTGKIEAIGSEWAQPECLHTGNWSRALPRVPREGEGMPLVPAELQWWRVFDDQGLSWTLAVAAPGVESLGVGRGDRVTLTWPVSWYGWDWPEGTVDLAIEGRGRVRYAINAASSLSIGEGRTECARPSSCGGNEWSMHVTVGGESFDVPAGVTVEAGNATFTNANAFRHADGYVEPDEEHEGAPGCEGPSTESFAVLVERLPS